ncbi:hypothetical protein B566_EDAN001102 [Ephemera danica]|nr:hypothetical protein B566_EDAN001102 [Ephemera danica]
MADTATCGATSTLRNNNNNTILHLNNNNNNSPNATNNNPPFNKQRKRKRLSQVVDKLTTQVGKSSPPSTPPPSSTPALLNNNFHKKNQNHVVKQELLDDDSCSHEGITHPTSEPYMFEQKVKGVLASPSDGEPDDDSEVQASKKPSPNTLLIHHHPPEASMAPSGDATMMTALNRGGSSPPTRVKSEVFRFDSVDRDRYHYGAISEEEDVFSPASRSPHSSAGGSPHVRVPTDSPKVAFSPLRIKDASMEEEKHHEHGPSQPRYPGCSCAHCSPLEVSPMDRFFPGGIGGVPASPVSPLTPCTPGGALPISPSPINSFEHYLHSKYLPDIFRRRSHSDSDIPLWFEGAALSIKSEATTATTNTTPSSNRAPRHNKSVPHPLTLPSKGGSLESETSTPQDSPLDLSVRGSRGSSTSSSIDSPYASRLSQQHPLLRAPTPATPPTPPQPAVTPSSDSPAPSPLVTATTSFLPRSLVPVPVVRGDVASPTTKESVAHRYNLEVSPVVEEMPPGSDVAYVCPVCGQMFSLHDRLAKHMASRHKSKQQSEQTTKAYLCDVCQRSFARSDMLTRHMRLHTGVKPYTCRVCGQVFSRSDHLSTHQRTHTGEKPYRCPQCPYAACRRDMITRHMRTHARYEAGGERGGSLGGSMDEGSGGGSDSPRGMTCPTPDPPPPLSPSQALSSLSVHSPSPVSPPEPMEND